MPAQKPHALVVGAGVVGLSTAVRLAESGLRIQVLTAELPRQTTSAVAGAIWGPYLSSDTRVHGWSFRTLDVLQKLAELPETGVSMVSGLEASQGLEEMPHWFEELPESRPARREELPAGYSAGCHYRAPVIEMPIYLDYLQQRLFETGTEITVAPISSLDEIVTDARVTVNCTGLAARQLVPDNLLYGMLGQLVIVENPGLEEFFAEYSEEPEVTYFMPQGDKAILGGVILPEDAAFDDPASAEAIQRRCREIAPMLDQAKVLQIRTGLRPCRPTIRLEHTTVNGRPVIHNYGHGGSGVSLSWACGDDVTTLVHGLI